MLAFFGVFWAITLFYLLCNTPFLLLIFFYCTDAVGMKHKANLNSSSSSSSFFFFSPRVFILSNLNVCSFFLKIELIVIIIVERVILMDFLDNVRAFDKYFALQYIHSYTLLVRRVFPNVNSLGYVKAATPSHSMLNVGFVSNF